MSPEPGDAAGAATAQKEDPATLRESVVGYVEVLGETRVAGWAWCRGRPEKPVEVEIRLGDRVLQRAQADRFRQDLVRAGVGDGRHGFNVVFDELLPRERISDLGAFVVCGPDGPYVPLASSTSKPAGRASKDNLVGNSREAAETSLQAILTAIPDLQKAMDERLGAVSGNIRSALTQLAAEAKLAARTIEAKCEELRSTQTSLERHISSLEVPGAPGRRSCDNPGEWRARGSFSWRTPPAGHLRLHPGVAVNDFVDTRADLRFQIIVVRDGGRAEKRASLGSYHHTGSSSPRLTPPRAPASRVRVLPKVRPRPKHSATSSRNATALLMLRGLLRRKSRRTLHIAWRRFSEKFITHYRKYSSSMLSK